MHLQHSISLLPFNTFHIDEIAHTFAVINHEEDLLNLIATHKYANKEMHIIGGGSNILLTKAVDGIVLINKIKGISIISENEEEMIVESKSGENWHDLVCWSLANNVSGIENLSLIPGTVGAAPIQNIGAYGVELKDVFVYCETIDLESGKKQIWHADACHFGYRQSIFKLTEKNKHFISSVTIRLSKKPQIKPEYGNIQEELIAMQVDNATIHHIAEAVIRIRERKLPNPAILGNAGSFFKNPVIPIDQFEELKISFSNLPSFPNPDGIKIPAAWLIENSGPDDKSSWKGFREKNFGVHDKQALCLVNFLDASGKEIYLLSEKIITSVQRKFNIQLEREVNIW